MPAECQLEAGAPVVVDVEEGEACGAVRIAAVGQDRLMGPAEDLCGGTQMTGCRPDGVPGDAGERRGVDAPAAHVADRDAPAPAVDGEEVVNSPPTSSVALAGQ